MKQTQKSDLKSAFILLKCSKTQHDDCRKIRDALIDKVSNIQEAYTTDAEVDNEKWCVAASALINAKEKEQFEKKLWSLEAEHDEPNAAEPLITIKQVQLLVDDQ